MSVSESSPSLTPPRSSWPRSYAAEVPPWCPRSYTASAPGDDIEKALHERLDVLVGDAGLQNMGLQNIMGLADFSNAQGGRGVYCHNLRILKTSWCHVTCRDDYFEVHVACATIPASTWLAQDRPSSMETMPPLKPSLGQFHV